MSETTKPPVLRTLVLALLALVLLALAGQLVGARVALSAGSDLGATGVAVAGVVAVLAVCLVVPLSLAARLIGALSSRSPHRPTVTLGLLSAWNLGLLALMVGVFPTRSAEALQAHGDWIPGSAETPVDSLSAWLGARVPGATSPDEPVIPEVVDPAEDGSEALPPEEAALPEAAAATVAPPPPWTPEVLFAQRADTVVVVHTRQPLDASHPLAELFRGMGMDAVEGQGSGFVVDAEAGLVVTNEHVLSGATEAVVQTRDGRRLGPVRVLRLDAANDLALLEVPVAGSLPEAPLAEPGAHGVGARTWAIGAPLGLEHSLTEGIVSGHRDVQGTRFLQMQTTIAPGSSGGPLFDDHGRVVGVSTATRSPGLNLAVQVDHVHELLAGERLAEAEPLADLAPGYVLEEVEVHGAELRPTSRQGIADVGELLARRSFTCLDEVPDGVVVGVWVPLGMGDSPEIGSTAGEAVQACLARDLRMAAMPLQLAAAQGQLPAEGLALRLAVRREADDAVLSVLLHVGGEARPVDLLVLAPEDGDDTLGSPQSGRSDQDQSASSTSSP